MAIIKPWEKKYGYDAGAYAIITTRDSLIEYSKRKRKLFTVILAGNILPIKCSRCGKLIKKDDANRTDVYPKKGIFIPKHYNCAWEGLLQKIYSPEMIERFGG